MPLASRVMLIAAAGIALALMALNLQVPERLADAGALSHAVSRGEGQMIGSHVAGESNQRAVDSGVDSPRPSISVPQLPGQLRLVGTVVSSNPAAGQALIDTGTGQARYKIGQTVAEHWEVAAIQSDRVRLEPRVGSGARSQTLFLVSLPNQTPGAVREDGHRSHRDAALARAQTRWLQQHDDSGAGDQYADTATTVRSAQTAMEHDRGEDTGIERRVIYAATVDLGDGETLELTSHSSRSADDLAQSDDPDLARFHSEMEQLLERSRNRREALSGSDPN